MVKNFVKGRVSIVTPVYNGETFLSRFLESIRIQTYRNLELILVDDGSSDQTVMVARHWKERLEKEVISMRIVEAPHRNASSAMGYGLPFVSGEYLCWPDSDDVLKETSIEERVEFLEKHPEYHCVRSLSWYFDPESGERTAADEKRGDSKKEDLFWDILEGRTYVCCGCYMLRSQDFFEIYPDGRIPVYPVGQNFQMLLPFMYRYKCPTIEKELYGAMEAVVGWNTFYEPNGKRIITGVSRDWNVYHGGYALFCWDCYFSALLAAPFSKEVAISFNCIWFKWNTTPMIPDTNPITKNWEAISGI